MTLYTNRSGMDRAYRARHIFRPYYGLLNELARGEVAALEDGTPVVEFEGRIEHAAPVILGWVACWQRIDARRPIGADLDAMTDLARHLEHGHHIPHALVAKARRALDTCLRAYKRLPLTLIRDAAQTEELASKFETMGLIGGEA